MPRRWKKNKLLQNFIKRSKKFTLLSQTSRVHVHKEDVDGHDEREENMEDDVSSDPQPMSSTGRPSRQNHLRQLEAWNSIHQHLVTQYVDSLAMRFGKCLFSYRNCHGLSAVYFSR